jgi:hypothetical protein
MVPPSIHPRTGRRYRFLDAAHSPKSLPLPAPCPGWVLALRPVEAPRRPPRPIRDLGHVLDAIPDKVALARSWGLRLAANRPNASGWIPCHAVGREDRTPSASISATTGCYWEPDLGVVPLCDLGVLLGAYPDRRAALVELEATYHAR